MDCCRDNSDMHAGLQVERIGQPFANFPLTTEANKT